MTDDTRRDERDEPEAYEAPAIEDLQAGDGASVTAAGATVTPGAE